MLRSSVLGIFGARFRMQLYRAGCLKYDKGHNLLPVEDKFHVDIVFGVAPWENGLHDLECDDGLFFDEGQTGMWGRDLCRERNETL